MRASRASLFASGIPHMLRCCRLGSVRRWLTCDSVPENLGRHARVGAFPKPTGQSVVTKRNARFSGVMCDSPMQLELRQA